MTDEDQTPGRRRYERRAVYLPARLESPDRGVVDGHVANIGSGGAFFLTDDLETLLAEGADVTLTIESDTPLGKGIKGYVLRIDTYFEDDRIIRSLAIRFDGPLPRLDRTKDPEGNT